MSIVPMITRAEEEEEEEEEEEPVEEYSHSDMVVMSCIAIYTKWATTHILVSDTDRWSRHRKAHVLDHVDLIEGAAWVARIADIQGMADVLLDASTMHIRQKHSSTRSSKLASWFVIQTAATDIQLYEDLNAKQPPKACILKQGTKTMRKQVEAHLSLCSKCSNDMNTLAAVAIYTRWVTEQLMTGNLHQLSQSGPRATHPLDITDVMHGAKWVTQMAADQNLSGAMNSNTMRIRYAIRDNPNLQT
jgi:hypothetical protein